jgi:hypothetical protein
VTIHKAHGVWTDSRGRRHKFKIDSDYAEYGLIRELVAAQYPCDEDDVVVYGINGDAAGYRTYAENNANRAEYRPQEITNSQSTEVTSGNIGMESVGNAVGSVANSDNGGVQVFGLLFLGFLCFIIYMSAPVIAFVGAGGLAFKVTKNRTHGLQWFKRTGIILLTTGLASMISFHGTLAAKDAVEVWWNNIETEQVSYE